jgi:hypothetical protein
VSTETVSGRSVLRYRGDPLHHVVRFYRTGTPHPGYRDGGVLVKCDAGDYETTIDGGHTTAELASYARQHETGTEDP